MIRQLHNIRRPQKRSRKSQEWTVEPVAAGRSARLGEIRARLASAYREIEMQLAELARLA